MVVLAGCGSNQTKTPDAKRPDAAIDAPLATSCVGLANTCGPNGTESCCDSTVVPGGTYARSYDLSGDGMFPDSSFGATVSDFRLDKYEVTVGRFRQFVMANEGTQASPPISGAGAHPNIAGSGWDASWNASLATDTTALMQAIKCYPMYQTWTDTPGGNESLPMDCITWYEAMAFCAWDDGFMPTEAEWNYAAAGGNEQRTYPWSSPPGFLGIDCSYANYYDGTGFCVDPPNGAANQVGSESPKGDGKFGQSDLGGNVFEWVLDWYAPYANPCSDCANLTPTFNRVIRGGAFGPGEDSLRTANRDESAPSARDSGTGEFGVRCARTP